MWVWERIVSAPKTYPKCFPPTPCKIMLKGGFQLEMGDCNTGGGGGAAQEVIDLARALLAAHAAMDVAAQAGACLWAAGWLTGFHRRQRVGPPGIYVPGCRADVCLPCPKWVGGTAPTVSVARTVVTRQNESLDFDCLPSVLWSHPPQYHISGTLPGIFHLQCCDCGTVSSTHPCQWHIPGTLACLERGLGVAPSPGVQSRRCGRGSLCRYAWIVGIAALKELQTARHQCDWENMEGNSGPKEVADL